MGRYTATNLPLPTIRLVVLGDKNVGKSALVVRFLTRRFIGEYASGTEFTYQKEINMSGSKIMTEICDSVMKKDSLNHLRKLSGTTEAFLLVYNVCSRVSFDYACQLAKEVKDCSLKSSSGENVPLLLVGNKSDLNHFREVKQSEGENFAKTMNMCHFVETSAAESYTEVERVFKLIFRLVRAYSHNTSPTPSVGSTRIGRKNSWSQVAHLIRDHYRKQHAISNQQPPASLPDRGIIFNCDESQSCDKNNNSTKTSISKRRMRKNSTLGFSSTPLPFASDKLRSKCLSLTTLSEDPKNKNANSMHLKFLQNKNQSFDNESNARSMSKEDSSVTKMSQSSDDTLELSDFSIPDEDAFLPETTDSTCSKNLKSNSLNRSKNNIQKTDPSLPMRKSSINKKNLKICIYSDNDVEDKTKGFDDLPPKSAPVVRSNSNNRYRFFPNGNTESPDSSKISYSSLFSPNAIPHHLEKSQRYVKSPKEEKKSPSQSFLKQFFKGTLQNSFASRACGSSQTLHQSSSSPSFETLASNSSEYSKNTLSAIDEHRSTPGLARKSFSSRPSSTSLSSASNDDAELESLNSNSTPSSPGVFKNTTGKTRKSSIREAVGGLIRKRKQSLTSEGVKLSKERFR